MAKPRAPKQKTGVRFDNNRIRLQTGETQRDNGTYIYRWTGNDGKRHAIYAPTLDELRSKEEQIVVDQHDGIKADVNKLTVNDMFDLWRQLKRGIKDSTFQNYIYMYETFVQPNFGKKRLTKVKKVAINSIAINDGNAAPKAEINAPRFPRNL